MSLGKADLDSLPDWVLSSNGSTALLEVSAEGSRSVLVWLCNAVRVVRDRLDENCKAAVEADAAIRAEAINHSSLVESLASRIDSLEAKQRWRTLGAMGPLGTVLADVSAAEAKGLEERVNAFDTRLSNSLSLVADRIDILETRGGTSEAQSGSSVEDIQRHEELERRLVHFEKMAEQRKNAFEELTAMQVASLKADIECCVRQGDLDALRDLLLQKVGHLEKELPDMMQANRETLKEELGTNLHKLREQLEKVNTALQNQVALLGQRVEENNSNSGSQNDESQRKLQERMRSIEEAMEGVKAAAKNPAPKGGLDPEELQAILKQEVEKQLQTKLHETLGNFNPEEFEKRVQALTERSSMGAQPAVDASPMLSSLEERVQALESRPSSASSNVHNAAIEGRVGALERMAQKAISAAQQALEEATAARDAAAAAGTAQEVAPPSADADAVQGEMLVINNRLEALEKAARDAMAAMGSESSRPPDDPLAAAYATLASRTEQLQAQVVELTSAQHVLKEELLQAKDPAETAALQAKSKEIDDRLGRLATEQLSLRQAVEAELADLAAGRSAPPPTVQSDTANDGRLHEFQRLLDSLGARCGVIEATVQALQGEFENGTGFEKRLEDHVQDTSDAQKRTMDALTMFAEAQKRMQSQMEGLDGSIGQLSAREPSPPPPDEAGLRWKGVMEDRVQILEETTKKALKPPAPPKEASNKQAWLEWRISWLEWCVGGVSRGFSRPVQEAAKGVSRPVPFTVTSTGFNQPMSEDTELWARVAGRMQPRRQRAQTTTGINFDGSATRLMRGSQSHGKLPAV